jgi:subtilisin
MLRQQHKKEKKFTGRTMHIMPVLPGTETTHNLLKKVRSSSGLKIASIRDFKSDFTKYKNAFKTGDGIYFDAVGVMIVNPQKEENIRTFSTREVTMKTILSEPERYVYAIQARQSVHTDRHLAADFKDSKLATWGIQATKTAQSLFTGKGIRIAVLDTGVYDKHPDFKKRSMILISKVSDTGVKPQDKDGHGTHCIGVSMGASDKSNLRYGVASGADIFSAKVLDDNGEGVDGDIIAGINWAVENKCRIISMSLGDEADFGDEFSKVYENVAKRAMAKGTLIVAAAGNESARSEKILRPIGHPANCPSIMAVAALDSNLKLADFSCTSDQDMGAQIDIAAPGVGIYSSYIKPANYEFLDGTSMATPFVAGIAALYLEQDPSLKPMELWSLLLQKARRLSLASVDVGAGLIQAPIN